MLGNKEEYERMAEAEGKHWWYSSLHERVLRTIQKQFTGKEIELLDAGCGTGGLLIYLRNNGYRNLQGFDISEIAVAACERNKLPVFKTSLTQTADHFQPASKDVITCCDALYFLSFEEQKKTLADFYKILKPGGVMILNLPALKIFTGTHDLSVGIRERYHHRMLKELLPAYAAGDRYSFRYWPVLLSPVVAAARALQRIRIKSGKYNAESDIDLPGAFVNGLLKGLMKLEMNYLPRINFGSSLFVTVRKTAYGQ
jgi:SAM-dependent methyltransferase